METEDKHPNLSFPICTSFVPDILEGQLCYTLNLNQTGGKGKRNGLMLLLDLNQQRSFETTLKKDQTIEDISQMSLDTELSRRDKSAKIQINAMSPTTEYGHGTYKMTSVKRMRATSDFLGMDQGTRNCELETYEECRTRHLMEICNCVPWELKQQRIKVRPKFFIQFVIFRMGLSAPHSAETVWMPKRATPTNAKPRALGSTPTSSGMTRLWGTAGMEGRKRTGSPTTCWWTSTGSFREAILETSDLKLQQMLITRHLVRII